MFQLSHQLKTILWCAITAMFVAGLMSGRSVPPCEIVPAVGTTWEDVHPDKNAKVERWEGKIVVHFPVDIDALQRRYQEAYPDDKTKVLGFTITDKETGACHIWMLRPKWVNDPYSTTVGHELMHCIWDQYHQ